MKKIVLAAAFAGAASTAMAGGMSEPMMEMEVPMVEEVMEKPSSSGNLIVPLIIVALIAAAAS